MNESNHYIESQDMSLFRVTDDVDEAVQIIRKCYDEECWLGPRPPQITGPAAEHTAEGTRVGIDPGHYAVGTRRGENRKS